MPIDDHLDTLSGGIWFSKLDAMSAYCHMQRNREDHKKVRRDCLAVIESDMEVVQKLYRTGMCIHALNML